MGKQTNENENIAEELEDVLGLNDNGNDSNNTDGSTQKEEQSTNDEKNGDVDSTKEEENTNQDKDKKEEDQNTKTKDTNKVTLTVEQVKINSEIAKIDTKLEDLEKNNTVDTDKFYDNLEEYLSEEEQQLEFDDKKAYLKLVKEKEADYIKSNSKDDEISTLKKEKEDLEKVYARQEGIKEVTAKYSDFNYEEVMAYYDKKLNKEQQEEVFKGAESYADVYENTYMMMTGKEPKEVKSAPAPNIPNVNNVRKENVSDDKLKDGLKTEDEELREALGL
jgi:hypothetical protein